MKNKVGIKMALTFQELILNLSKYWSDYGCIIQQPYDIEKGASTMNPASPAPIIFIIIKSFPQMVLCHCS